LVLNCWVRVRVPVEEDDAEVPSLAGLWSGANWFERETFDLFGIRFTNHPDPTRILMPDEWEGHPLRKDYQPPKEPHEWSFNPEEWQKAVQRGG
jgi:NADH-quinone oxidoreductase subunit C